jgi:hypothetical protein
VSRRLSSSSGSIDSSERIKLFRDDDSSSETSVESLHEVPKLEKLFYYFGLRGDGDLGPKLVYRTSTDILGQNKIWATIREKVRDLLEA